MALPVAITFIRHSMTKANEEKRYIGFSDERLSENGKAMIKPSSLYPKADFYLASDLQRAIETLTMIAPNASYEKSSKWRELNFGDFELKTYEQLKENEAYKRWMANPFSAVIPNGEAFPAFKNRINDAFESLLEHVIQNNVFHALVVTHGGVIRYLLTELSGEERSFWEWPVPFASGYTLYFDRKELGRKRRCILLQEVPLTENGHL